MRQPLPRLAMAGEEAGIAVECGGAGRGRERGRWLESSRPAEHTVEGGGTRRAAAVSREEGGEEGKVAERHWHVGPNSTWRPRQQTILQNR